MKNILKKILSFFKKKETKKTHRALSSMAKRLLNKAESLGYKVTQKDNGELSLIPTGKHPLSWYK